VPVVSGFFIWTKRKYLRTREPTNLGLFFLATGALLYGLGFFWEIKTLGALSLLIVVTGIVLVIFGMRTAREIVFSLVFLLFMIPFPFIQNLAYGLQEISIRSSAWLTGALGLPLTTSGTEIYLGDITFSIGLPCSGINTFIALLALTAVYAYIITGPVYRRLILFIMAFPMAIAANILRISTIITLAYYTDIETATGWYHDISSLIFFIIAFCAIVLIGWAIKCRLNFRQLRYR